MVKRSRDQSTESPRRRICAAMVPPDCAFHCPDALDEGLARQVGALAALRVQLPLDHHLGGDAGVVGAGLPQRVIARACGDSG